MCFIVKCVFLSLAARTHTVCVDDKQTEDDEENTATTTKSQQQPYPKTFIHPAKIYVFVCIKCGFQVRQHHNFHNAATAPKNVDSVLHSNLLPSPVCSQRSTQAVFGFILRVETTHRATKLVENAEKSFV